jgi:hypothetical protein
LSDHEGLVEVRYIGGSVVALPLVSPVVVARGGGLGEFLNALVFFMEEAEPVLRVDGSGGVLDSPFPGAASALEFVLSADGGLASLEVFLGWLGVSEFDVGPEHLQFALLEGSHGLLDGLDASSFFSALLGLEDEFLVDSDELLLLFEEHLGFNGELSLLNISDGLDKERPHEAPPFGFEIHIGLPGDGEASDLLGLVGSLTVVVDGLAVNFLALLRSLNLVEVSLVILSAVFGNAPFLVLPEHELFLLVVHVKVLAIIHGGGFDVVTSGVMLIIEVSEGSDADV